MKLPEPKIAILVKQSDLTATADELRRLRERNAWLEDKYERLTNHNNMLVDSLRWAKRAYVLLLVTQGVDPIGWDYGDVDEKIGALTEDAPPEVRGGEG